MSWNYRPTQRTVQDQQLYWQDQSGYVKTARMRYDGQPSWSEESVITGPVFEVKDGKSLRVYPTNLAAILLNDKVSARVFYQARWDRICEIRFDAALQTWIDMGPIA